MIPVKSSHVETYRNPTIQNPSALTITYRNHTQRSHSSPTLSAKTLHNATNCALTDLTSSAIAQLASLYQTISVRNLPRLPYRNLTLLTTPVRTPSALPIRNITDYARPNHVCHNSPKTNQPFPASADLTPSAIARHSISNHNLTRPVCHIVMQATTFTVFGSS